MSLPNTGPRPSALTAMQPMIYSLLAAPILLGVAVWFTVPSMDEPPIWTAIVPLALVVVGFLLAESVGYAAPTLPGQTDRPEAMRRAVGIWRSKLMFRFAVTEAPILVGLTMSFIADSRWPFLVGLVAGWPVLAFEILPHRRSIEKLRARLDGAGASSFLDEALREPVSP
ncbi:hypothetical protein [Flindersiella endophytica]